MVALLIALSVLNIMISFLFLRKQEGKIVLSLDNIFIFCYMFFIYVGFPICYINLLEVTTYDNWREFVINYTTFEVFIYYFVALIVEIVFVKSLRIKRLESLNLNNSVFISKEKEFTFPIFHLSIIVFIIGLFCEWLYLRAYGGYNNYLEYSKALRSGIIIIKNQFSFLQPFRKLIVFSSYLFLVQIEKNNRNKLLIVGLYLISLFFSFRVLYANAGRLSMISFIIIQLLFLFLKKFNFITFKTVALLFCISFIFVGLVGFIGSYLEENISESLIDTLCGELSFIFANFNVEFKNVNQLNFRWLIDIVVWPIYFLPSSIWTKLGIKTSADINTALILGSQKGVNGVTGEIPTDLISISYMQLGIIGLIILPFVYGFIFNKLFTICDRFKSKDLGKMLKVYLSFEIAFTIIYADPLHIINAMFPFFVFIILVFIFDFISKYIKLSTKNKNL